MARKSQGSRSFTIADAMILIAASAVGIAWSGSNWNFVQPGMQPFVRSSQGIIQRGVELTVVALPCLTFWNFAALGLGLRQPRPSWRRVSRQPGMVACLGASLPLVLAMVIYAGLLFRLLRYGPLPPEFWEGLPGSQVEFLLLAAPFMGIGVTMAWFMLAVQRSWRSERSWIDRLGRILGVLWIVATLFTSAFAIARLF